MTQSHSTTAPPKRKVAKAAVPWQYRLMILYRFILAGIGGYLLASLSAINIAKAMADTPSSAATTATLLAFCIYTAAFIWVFMVQKTLKASLGILLPCALLYVIHFGVGL